MEKWYALTPEQIANKLRSNLSQGLSKNDVATRLQIQGANLIYDVPKGSFKTYFKHILTDLTSILLVIVAIIASVFQQNISAAVIIGLIVFNITVVALTYVKAHRVLEDIGYYSQPTAKVLRDGRMHIVKCEKLVPGDIIFLSVGDIVPADARLIKSEKLTVLETSLTGVPSSVRKDARFTEVRDIPPSMQQCMIFSSTIVTGGNGRAVVCDTSDATLAYRMQKHKHIVTHENLAVFGQLKKYSSFLSLCMIALVFVIVLIDMLFGHLERSIFDGFITGLTLAVASMSEFYIAFGYITVAFGIFRAINRTRDINSGSLIKNTEKLEVLKDITTLIVPKSSIIATDSIHVERVYANGLDLSYDNPGFKRNSANVIRYAVISTGQYGGQKLIADNISGNYVYSRDEELIIDIAKQTGYYNVELDKQYPIVQHIPFGNGSRFETTLCYHEGKFVVALRGDAMQVLGRCYHYRDGAKIVPMTERRLHDLKVQIPRITRENYKMIAVATKVTQYNNLRRIAANQDDLVLEGFIIIKEPLLEGAAKNIARCVSYGIRIIMTTDDVDDNNVIIAKTLGIIDKESESITGVAVSNMKRELFRTNTSLYNLYQNLSVSQTRELISSLRDDGQKVGSLSRTLGEISLLSESDVGFSQGVTLAKNIGSDGVDMEARHMPLSYSSANASMASGCEALKYVSDVVISEPGKSGSGGFNAMLGAVKTAKVVYQNLLRTVRYLAITTVSRLIIVLFGVISGSYLLSPVQILFSGLIVDLFSMFTIAFQPPSLFVLNEKNDGDGSIKQPLQKNYPYIIIGFLWAATTVLLPYILKWNNIYISSSELVSAVFIGFTSAQLIVLMEVKKEYSLFFPSASFNGVGALMLAVCVTLVLFSYRVSGFGALFGIVPISSSGWLIVVVMSVIVALSFEIFKLIKFGKTVHINWSFGKEKKSDETVSSDVAPKEKVNVEKPKNIAELFENFDLEEFITGDTPEPIEKKEIVAESGKTLKKEEEKEEEYLIGKNVIDNIFSVKKDDNEE